MSITTVPIISRLPEHEFALRRLCGLDAEFKALCDDYAIATQALADWHHDATRAAQYANLVVELEREVLRFIAHHHPRQTSSR
nr:hypothetical protein [Marinicella sp. W31]MDC2876808.1 hypothetical protein [Marinicella sp. W31]